MEGWEAAEGVAVVDFGGGLGGGWAGGEEVGRIWGVGIGNGEWGVGSEGEGDGAKLSGIEGMRGIVGIREVWV